MASILFSYVDSDQPEARRLSAVLEAAGHRIVGGLQDADVVLVIWSSAALSSPHIHERAAVALGSGCLVQVVTRDLDVAHLPGLFRSHAVVAIGNTNAVVEEVHRVLKSTREQSLAAFKGSHEGTKEGHGPPSPPHGQAPRRDSFWNGPLPGASGRPDGRFRPSAEPVQSGPSLAAAAARAPARGSAVPLAEAPHPRTRARRVEGGEPAAPDELALSLDDIFEGATAPVVELPIRPPAPSPDPVPQPISPELSKAALERQVGQLNHKIPESMRVGATEVVEVRLGRARQNIATGLLGSGALTVEQLPIVETMTVDLYGAPGAFTIVRQSRETQLVKSSLIWSSPFDERRFGRWIWHVTPKKSGTHELVVKVSADLSDSRGVATTEPYGDRTFSVKVRVNLAQASVRVLKWSAAGAISALAGAVTQEIWWPRLKALLVGTGLLG